MQAWIEQHPAAFVVALLIWFVLVWLAAIGSASYLSGWASLARRYRLTSTFLGEKWAWQSGRMRFGAHYGNCLTLGCDEFGLYLATMKLFSFRHPPLLIPWGDIRVTYTRWMLVSQVRLDLGRDPEIPLFLRPRVAERLRQAAGSRWPVQSLG